jgi:hypothetical protein
MIFIVVAQEVAKGESYNLHSRAFNNKEVLLVNGLTRIVHTKVQISNVDPLLKHPPLHNYLVIQTSKRILILI